MDKIAKLKAELSVNADKLEILVSAEPDKFDEKAVSDLEAVIAGQTKQLKAMERSRDLQAGFAVPAKGQPGLPGDRAEEPNFVRYGKLKAFAGQGGNARAYKVGQFCRATLFGNEEAIQWCKDNGVSLIKAQAEGVNSSGGVLVPEEMMNEIIVLRETYGVFRQNCRVVPMGRDTLNWPRRTGGLTAYFMNEGGAFTESSASFDNVSLTAKKLGALTKLSTEIAEDAVINIADYIVDEIAYAFASKEDDCGFNGDGTSTYGGMTGAIVGMGQAAHSAGLYTATGHSTYATLDNTDITSLMGKLPQYALPGAKFFCSQTAFATVFERLIGAAGGNSINTLDGSVQYRYLGFPIVISQKLPTTGTVTATVTMLFGDLAKAAAMGERRGVTIRRLNERYADNDQIGIIGTERFDINVHDLGDSTTPGPLVALKMG
jgi:HK97 family phage major capsid protein